MTKKKETETVQDIPAAEEPAPAQTEPEAAQQQLEEARAQAEDFKRKWYSVSAEYENYRRRTANQNAQRYAEGRADVV